MGRLSRRQLDRQRPLVPHVWAISGPSSANKHVKMALFECYLYGTRVK